MESDKTVSEKVPTVQDIVQRIVDMAKVLYGLHMVRTSGARLGGCVADGLSPGGSRAFVTDGRAVWYRYCLIFYKHLCRFMDPLRNNGWYVNMVCILKGCLNCCHV